MHAGTCPPVFSPPANPFAADSAHGKVSQNWVQSTLAKSSRIVSSPNRFGRISFNAFIEGSESDGAERDREEGGMEGGSRSGECCNMPRCDKVSTSRYKLISEMVKDGPVAGRRHDRHYERIGDATGLTAIFNYFRHPENMFDVQQLQELYC
jgi:hypothetical protein